MSFYLKLRQNLFFFFWLGVQWFAYRDVNKGYRREEKGNAIERVGTGSARATMREKG
jgi:hypothetical protein